MCSISILIILKGDNNMCKLKREDENDYFISRADNCIIFKPGKYIYNNHLYEISSTIKIKYLLSRENNGVLLYDVEENLCGNNLWEFYQDDSLSGKIAVGIFRNLDFIYEEWDTMSFEEFSLEHRDHVALLKMMGTIKHIG